MIYIELYKLIGQVFGLALHLRPFHAGRRERLSGNSFTPTRARSILAVMKHRTTTMSEPVQYKMDVTDLDHGRTGFSITLIVLTIPSTSTMPGVRPLNHPEFRQGRKTFRSITSGL